MAVKAVFTIPVANATINSHPFLVQTVGQD